jgi:NAD(P)-dependent dehydrogenase (short-subunit alcohol dehydrogenase family)
MHKTILITGANGKLGRVLCKHYLDKGYFIVGIVSGEKSKNELSQIFNKYLEQHKLFIIIVDLTEDNSSVLIIDKLTYEGIEVNYIVHTARNLSFLQISGNGITSNANFSNEFKLGVVLPYKLTMEMSLVKNSALMSVVFVSSMYGVVPYNPNLYNNPKQETPIQYSIVKSAQIHLTKELAIRLAPNIRVNAVSLGGILGRASADFIARYSELCPMKRMLQEEEIIGPVDFLLSDSSSSITGHNLIADGGWTTW